jgi:putative transcriptional regulator
VDAWIGQAFPIYWLGLGMRLALLPDATDAVEIGGSWRHLQTAGVLGTWMCWRSPWLRACCGGWAGAPPAPRSMPPRRANGRGRGVSETLDNRIAMLRAERKISRRELAEALGVHYQTVGYLERGEYSLSLYLTLRVAEFFEVPVEVVFSIKPFPRLGQT